MPSVNGYFGPLTISQQRNLWGPLLNIGIYSYPDSHDNPQTTPLKYPVVALIDTGSMLCSLDIDLAIELNLQKGEGGNFLQLGHTVKAESYFATIHVPELNYKYFADLMGSPFKRGDVPFNVILGWDFLCRFNITLSNAANLVRLDFIG